jgi:hypothetical protein
VGVEKLDLSKLVEKSLRQDALQTTFSVLRHFVSPNFGCLEGNWTFSTPTPVLIN